MLPFDKITDEIDHIVANDDGPDAFPHSIFADGNFYRTDTDEDEDGEFYVLIHAESDLLVEIDGKTYGTLHGFRYYPEEWR